jgi:hypothetical protein
MASDPHLQWSGPIDRPFNYLEHFGLLRSIPAIGICDDPVVKARWVAHGGHFLDQVWGDEHYRIDAWDESRGVNHRLPWPIKIWGLPTDWAPPAEPTWAWWPDSETQWWPPEWPGFGRYDPDLADPV